MADFHKYKFLYGGNKEYADGWERIFKKKKRKTKRKGKKTWQSTKQNTS